MHTPRLASNNQHVYPKQTPAPINKHRSHVQRPQQAPHSIFIISPFPHTHIDSSGTLDDRPGNVCPRQTPRRTQHGSCTHRSDHSRLAIFLRPDRSGSLHSVWIYCLLGARTHVLYKHIQTALLQSGVVLAIVGLCRDNTFTESAPVLALIAG